MSIVIQGRALALDHATTTHEVARLICAQMIRASAVPAAPPAPVDLDEPTSLDIPVSWVRQPPVVRRGPIRLPTHPKAQAAQ